MLKKNKIGIILLLLIIILIFIIIFLKNEPRVDLNLSQSVPYKVSKVDKYFYKVDLDNKKKRGEKAIFNEFINQNIYSRSYLVKTKSCKNKNIFLSTIYNNKVYSEIYKLKPLFHELYVSTYNSDNHLNFSHLEIHKNDINCIDEILEVSKNKIPLTHKIIKNIDISLNKKNIKKLDLSTSNFKILKRDRKLRINKNIISLDKNIGFNQKKNLGEISLFQKLYLRNIKKPFLFEDLLWAKIDGEQFKSLIIRCKITSGSINFIIFDGYENHLIDKDSCSNDKKIYLEISEKKELDFIITAQTLRVNSDELSFKLYLDYNS